MPAYQINGLSGTGKTAIGRELARRGHKVIDTDAEFGCYANLETEEPVEFPQTGHPSQEWYQANGWMWDRAKVQATLNGMGSEAVFLCGGSLNEQHFYHRMAIIFRLYTEPRMLRDRLLKRHDRHSSNPVFVRRMLDLVEPYRMDAIGLGWPVIDTSERTVEQSADEILGYVHRSDR